MKKMIVVWLNLIHFSQILFGSESFSITDTELIFSMESHARRLLSASGMEWQNASDTASTFFEEVNQDTFVVACALLERESCFEELRAIEHQQDLILFRKKYIPDGEDFTELFNELVIEKKQFNERVEMIEAFIIERITSPKD